MMYYDDEMQAVDASIGSRWLAEELENATKFVGEFSFKGTRVFIDEDREVFAIWLRCQITAEYIRHTGDIEGAQEWLLPNGHYRKAVSRLNAQASEAIEAAEIQWYPRPMTAYEIERADETKILTDLAARGWMNINTACLLHPNFIRERILAILAELEWGIYNGARFSVVWNWDDDTFLVKESRGMQRD